MVFSKEKNLTHPRLTVISYKFSKNRSQLLSVDEEAINETLWIDDGDHEQFKLVEIMYSRNFLRSSEHARPETRCPCFEREESVTEWSRDSAGQLWVELTSGSRKRFAIELL